MESAIPVERDRERREESRKRREQKRLWFDTTKVTGTHC